MKKTKKYIAALGIAVVAGSALLPLCSYAAENEVQLNVHVGTGIAMAIDGSSVHSVPSLTSGQKDETMKTVIKVSTNSESGYTLTVKDKDTDLNLKNGSYTIPAASSVTAGTAGWAYKVDNGSYKAITATAATVKTSSTATDQDTITIHYGVGTAVTTHGGDYTDTIVFTAQANS